VPASAGNSSQRGGSPDGVLASAGKSSQQGGSLDDVLASAGGCERNQVAIDRLPVEVESQECADDVARSSLSTKSAIT
jgi:hypothetical protein